MNSPLRHIIAFYFSVLLHCIGSGQSLAQWTMWGDAAFAKGEYYGASRFYAGALELEPGRMGLQWKQAESCRLSNQYDRAAPLYERVYRKDMGRSHPDALRWLGEMQLCMGAYSDAERTWQKALQKERDKSSFVAVRAKNALEGCELATATDTKADSISIEHLPAPVNTFDSEFGARIGPDPALYFTSLRGSINKEQEVEDTSGYHTAIYRSQGSETVWAEPTDFIRTSDGSDVANITWTSDQQHVLFTKCPRSATCRIEIAPTADPTRSRPVQGIDTAFTSTQPMIAIVGDRQFLFFVSDAPSGTGGMDIWASELKDDIAIDPKPIGPPLNSIGDERSPWFEKRTNTLYFSSDFLPGFGGYDVFTSKLNSDGTYDTPKNAGMPINSPANDLYPSFYPDRNEGWVTSNRIGSFAAKGETCCNDLYRFSLAEAPLVPLDEMPLDSAGPVTAIERTVGELQAEFPLRLYFHNDDPEPRSWSRTTDQQYGTTFERYMAKRSEYERENKRTDALRAFFVDEVEYGYAQLNALARALTPVLASGEKIILEVRGHASPLARSDYNTNLSLRRIESLRNHLRKANDGALSTYMDSSAANGGTLRLRDLPFGEDRSASGVSDDLKHLDRSVYSVEAARERRIEVERILVEPKVREIDLDIGTVRQGEERSFKLPIRNSSAVPLHIIDTRSECECTIGRKPEGPIAPGASGDIEIVFTGRSRPGPLVRRIIVLTDGTPERIIVLVNGTVVE